jgi:hypothetical protein
MSAVSVKIPASINCGGPLSAMDSFLCFFAAYWHGLFYSHVSSCSTRSSDAVFTVIFLNLNIMKFYVVHNHNWN